MSGEADMRPGRPSGVHLPPQTALELRTLVMALTIDDRKRILRALDDPPTGLAQLHAVLLLEHEGRVRDGSFSEIPFVQL